MEKLPGIGLGKDTRAQVTKRKINDTKVIVFMPLCTYPNK